MLIPLTLQFWKSLCCLFLFVHKGKIQQAILAKWMARNKLWQNMNIKNMMQTNSQHSNLHLAKICMAAPFSDANTIRKMLAAKLLCVPHNFADLHILPQHCEISKHGLALQTKIIKINNCFAALLSRVKLGSLETPFCFSWSSLRFEHRSRPFRS